MKRNILIFFAIPLFLALGCEELPVGNAFLEKAPGVDVTKDTVFKNIEYAQRFLWGAYATLRYGINTAQNGKPNIMSHDLLEDLTDLSQTYLTWGGAYTVYYTGQYMATTENSSDLTKYSYTRDDSWVAIRKAYIFLENIDKVPDGDAALKTQLKAEAKMIIACQYADMFRYFGGLPWLDKSYGAQEEPPKMPRMTAQETCDKIVALCDEAAAVLPWTITDMANWDGRFTKAAAMGLKARMLLFNASPLFNAATPYLDGEAATGLNVWHGSYDANRWKKAADAARDLIVLCEAGPDYKIYRLAGNTLRKDFQDAYYIRGNGEVLISTRVMFRAPNAGWTYTFYWSSNGWGSGCATDDYVKMFPMANGKPITDPTAGYNPAFPFFTAAGVPVRDPRLYETVKINGDYYQGRTVETWIGGRERQTQGGTAAATGYAVRKFQLENNTTTTYGSIVHWPYLRLAEIYLSYAEADNEFNNGPSAEAYRCVNIIRSRVGLGNLPVGLTRDLFREAVLTERALEFGWEEVRWFDLVRWKKANDFTKTLKGMNLFRSANAPYTYTFTQFNLPLRYWAQTWSPKWYLSAFAQNEINKQYGLIQNPGW